jgi:hypothetical protein
MREWTDVEHPICNDRIIYKWKFTTSDPQGNTAELTQMYLLKADVEVQWDVFPEDKELIVSEGDDRFHRTSRKTNICRCLSKDVALK